MNSDLPKQTIFNLFEGKSTPLEDALIREWLIEPANREQYFQWLEEWERENPQFVVDVDQAYARSLQTVSAGNQPDTDAIVETPVYAVGSWRQTYYWAAASLVLLLITATYLFREKWLYKRYETGYGEIQTIHLPDNSRVSLNAHSILTVPRFGFGSGTREVQLFGEAEFSIQHLPDHRRFIVRTPNRLEIQVLGTEFIVYSRERGSKVVLSQGKVQLRTLINQAAKPVLMTPGDVATLSPKGFFSLRHRQPLAIHQAWKEHRFAFNNTSLVEIAFQLGEQFGVNVVIPDSALAQRTIGGTFQAKTAADILQVLADVLNLQVIHKQQPGQSPDTFLLVPN